MTSRRPSTSPTGSAILTPRPAAVAAVIEAPTTPAASRADAISAPAFVAARAAALKSLGAAA